MKSWIKYAAALAAWPVAATTPSYDSATGRLDLPEVEIDAHSYSGVVLRLGADGRYELLSYVAPLSAGVAENGQTLSLALGQYLELRLAANYTTGYAWRFDDLSIAVLARQGDPRYVADDTGDSTYPATGGGGTETWKFKAIQAGTGTLRLEYRRSWETGGEPLVSVEFPVVVE